MSIERIVRGMAGFVVLLSLSLGVEASPLFHNINWLWLTTFAGLNLLQSSFTGFCPPEFIMKKFGIKSSGSCCS